MSEEKIVMRRLLISLALICVFLAACLVGSITLFTFEINDKNQIINLQKSTILINNQTVSEVGSYNYPWYFVMNYTGYVSVQVYNSTASNLMVEMTEYSWWNYDQQVFLHSNGIAYFPVLLGNIEIRIRAEEIIPLYDPNSGLVIGPITNETITITYRY